MKTACGAATPSAACSPALASTIPQALLFLRTNPSARPLYQLRPGKPLTVETDDDGRLINLRFVTGDGQRLSIARDGEDLVAETVGCAGGHTVEDGRRRNSVVAVRRGGCGGPSRQRDAADGRRLRRRHRFLSRSAARRPLHGRLRGAVRRRRSRSGVGSIVAAEFENRGRAIRAFLWRGEDGVQNYYAPGWRSVEEGLPSLADGILPRGVRLFGRALPPDPADVARAQGRGLRGAPSGTPVRATGDAKVAVVGSAARLRQRHRAAAQRRVRDALRSSVAFRAAGESRCPGRAGRRHRLCRADRLGDGSPPALRIPRGRRAAQSADGGASDG